MSIIYHKHHIVPRHMGGTDESSNLIELTVEEHAEAHKKLYEQHGKEEDRIAWLTLSGQASKPEAMRLAAKLGKAKTDKILEERYGSDWKTIHAKYASQFSSEKFKRLYQTDKTFKDKINANLNKAVQSARSPESNNKRKNSFSKIKHQQGANNSNFGKMWISNLELGESKTHPKNDPIPSGWVKGRKFGSGGRTRTCASQIMSLVT